MTGFDRTPSLLIRPDGQTFVVANTVTYTGSQGDSWRIPSGYVTDLATIPNALSWAVPKLGAYSRAAIVHDVLCDDLADHYAGRRELSGDEVRVLATPVDADAIFRKIAKENGTDRVTARLLWVGVRWGALANPSRRAGWLSTAPSVLLWSTLWAPLLVPVTLMVMLCQMIMFVARKAVGS